MTNTRRTNASFHNKPSVHDKICKCLVRILKSDPIPARSTFNVATWSTGRAVARILWQFGKEPTPCNIHSSTWAALLFEKVHVSKYSLAVAMLNPRRGPTLILGGGDNTRPKAQAFLIRRRMRPCYQAPKGYDMNQSRARVQNTGTILGFGFARCLMHMICEVTDSFSHLTLPEVLREISPCRLDKHEAIHSEQ